MISAAATRAGSNFVFRDVIPPFVGHVSGHASGYYPAVKGVTG